MNAERLLQLYDRIAEAPDAVSRLRRFVLDLAVRGKLVEQNPEDEPASELLQRIASGKAELAKSGPSRKRAVLTDFAIDQAPFDIPESWEWVPATYPAHGISDAGKKIKTKEVLETGLFPVVDQGKQLIRGFCNNKAKVISVDEPLIVFGDHTRETKLIDFDFVVGADGVKLLQPVGVDAKFYFLLLQWLPLESRGYGRHFKLLKASCVPLPPLAEQHRIVAKVDELMTLCDRLEETHNTRETTRDRLTIATLTRLTAPDTDNKSFRTHAHFALDTLPALTARPDQIKALRQTIFNLAVRGKLVEQNPADEPASESLKRIVEQRLRSLPPLTDDDTTFPVPTGWTWCRLGDLVLDSDSGWSPRTENHPREGDKWGVLKVSAVSWGRFDPTENKQLLRGAEPRLQAQVHEGDFLLSRANTAELVARAVLVPQEPQKLMMSDKIVRLRLGSDCVPRFVWLVNNYADFARTYYATKATGVSPSMKNVSRAVILELPIPLPPLSEQNRIVAKIDELMALCDQLGTGLDKSSTAHGCLLESLLHKVLQHADQELEVA